MSYCVGIGGLWIKTEWPGVICPVNLALGIWSECQMNAIGCFIRFGRWDNDTFHTDECVTVSRHFVVWVWMVRKRASLGRILGEGKLCTSGLDT